MLIIFKSFFFWIREPVKKIGKSVKIFTQRSETTFFPTCLIKPKMCCVKEAAGKYSEYRYDLVSVRGWPESGSSTVPGERPKCRLIKEKEWSMKAVASAVEQYLVTSSHKRCVVLCSDKYVTKLKLTSPHLLYTGQQQQQGAVERWLEGEGEGVLVTTADLFRGCEAQAVVWVDSRGPTNKMNFKKVKLQ